MTTGKHHELATRPGSDGEHMLQDMYGSTDRANKFYEDQMLDRLSPRMVEFISEQSWFFLSTADADGRPAGSPRWGEPGFVAVIDDRTLAWPELRGNGVMTSLGNVAKNPLIHLVFLDSDQRIGLHVNGQAVLVDADAMAAEYPQITERPRPGKAPERWVLVSIETDYIHCRKHFPRTDGVPVDWSTDDVKAKGGDYFGAKSVPSPWAPITTTPPESSGGQARAESDSTAVARQPAAPRRSGRAVPTPRTRLVPRRSPPRPR